MRHGQGGGRDGAAGAAGAAAAGTGQRRTGGADGPAPSPALNMMGKFAIGIGALAIAFGVYDAAVRAAGGVDAAREQVLAASWRSKVASV
jgi:hypothetical protein